MKDATGQERLFNEKEIRAILKRATEITINKSESSSSGLTLDELQHLAVETGVSPEAVREAAFEVMTRSPRRVKSNFWGGPATWTSEKVVRGSIDENKWEHMLTEIRRSFKYAGEVRQRGNSFEWSQSSSNHIQAHVTATHKEDNVHLQIFWHDPNAIGAFLGPFLPFAIMLIPAVFAPEAMNLKVLGIGVYLALVSCLLLLVRTFVSTLIKKDVRKITSLENKLVDIIRSEPDKKLEEVKEKEVLHFDQTTEEEPILVGRSRVKG